VSPSASAGGGGLAATGSNDVLGWTAATGITALAGGLLLLRRRERARHESR
jgi:LPXTG-motif cell wall-anchored protein